MKGIIIAAILCGLLAVTCRAYPTSELASAQWHVFVPAFGCGQVVHRIGGGVFRVFVCDNPQGPCVAPVSVDPCPLTAQVLGAKPNSERVVNVRSREHLVRFYNSFGAACYLTVLPRCTFQEQVEAQADDKEECKSLELPTGEVLYDPLDCAPKAEKAAEDKEECRSITLPTGEVLYDPLDCDPKFNGDKKETSQKNSMVAALMKLLMEN